MDDRCFVNVHGSMPIPPEFQPTWSYEGILAWFQSDNPWANQEGLVILTARRERFKIHPGHFIMEGHQGCGVAISLYSLNGASF
jgi:hypothetical protein